MSLFSTIAAGIENLGAELGLVSDIEKTVAFFKKERASGLSIAKSLCNLQMAKSLGQDFIDAAELVLCFIPATSAEAQELAAVLREVQKAEALANQPTPAAPPVQPAAQPARVSTNATPAPVTTQAQATAALAEAAAAKVLADKAAEAPAAPSGGTEGA